MGKFQTVASGMTHRRQASDAGSSSLNQSLFLSSESNRTGKRRRDVSHHQNDGVLGTLRRHCNSDGLKQGRGSSGYVAIAQRLAVCVHFRETTKGAEFLTVRVGSSETCSRYGGKMS